MPQGYDTILDNEGGNLSVGQRQLLTIARVFLCNPPILILDEATSSVDTRTEKEITKAMQELMNGRTSYSNEFKLEVVKYCIEGHHGFKSNVIEHLQYHSSIANRYLYLLHNDL